MMPERTSAEAVSRRWRRLARRASALIGVLIGVLCGTGAYAATATVQGEVQRVLATDDGRFGGCMAALDVAPADAGLDCPGRWVTFDCTGEYVQRAGARRMFESLRTAVATDKTVAMRVTDERKHDGFCHAHRIVIQDAAPDDEDGDEAVLEADVPLEFTDAAAHCRPGDSVKPGDRCDIFGTDHRFEVEASGRGCLHAWFTRCSARSVSYRGSNLTLVAARGDDDTWTIDAVDPVPPTWGAISFDFRVSSRCPGLAAGLATDELTEEAAVSAARRACRDDGGSTSRCREGTGSFWRGCAALAYGLTSAGCHIRFGDGKDRASAESGALKLCRDDGGRNCRIWTNGANDRISGCNAGTGGAAPGLVPQSAGFERFQGTAADKRP